MAICILRNFLGLSEKILIFMFHFQNVTGKRRPHEIPSQKTLTLPRNTKEVCDILKMCNTNISIIFRLNKHKLLNFYMKPCWQKVFIRSKKFKNQLTFFNTVNHMTNSSLSNPCIDTPLNSSKFNIYIHLKIKLFNPKNEHKNKS